MKNLLTILILVLAFTNVTKAQSLDSTKTNLAFLIPDDFSIEYNAQFQHGKKGNLAEVSEIALASQAWNLRDLHATDTFNLVVDPNIEFGDNGLRSFVSASFGYNLFEGKLGKLEGAYLGFTFGPRVFRTSLVAKMPLTNSDSTKFKITALGGIVLEKDTKFTKKIVETSYSQNIEEQFQKFAVDSQMAKTMSDQYNTLVNQNIVVGNSRTILFKLGTTLEYALTDKISARGSLSYHLDLLALGNNSKRGHDNVAFTVGFKYLL